jgi:hypothetical protein
VRFASFAPNNLLRLQWGAGCLICCILLPDLDSVFSGRKSVSKFPQLGDQKPVPRGGNKNEMDDLDFVTAHLGQHLLCQVCPVEQLPANF